MLAEKYRPTSIDEVVGIDPDPIKAMLERGNPNFLFHGAPGTGKTSLARAIAAEVEADMGYSEFNASDDRGIHVVRGQIRRQARTVPFGGGSRVIFLDECEQLPRDSQQALRGVMEDSPAIFILASNNLDSVTDPIKSRCLDIEFDPAPEAVHARLEEICEVEDVNPSSIDLRGIVEDVGCDFRAALNRLEYRIGDGDVGSQ